VTSARCSARTQFWITLRQLTGECDERYEIPISAILRQHHPVVLGTAAVAVTNHSSHDADRGHMSMLMPSTVASFTPLSAEIPKTGWTATASDQAGPYPASNAIDGNSGTIWHSYYTPTAKPLPHSLTIDMHATRSVSGLTYLPRQDVYKNGRIGQYSVSVERRWAELESASRQRRLGRRLDAKEYRFRRRCSPLRAAHRYDRSRKPRSVYVGSRGRPARRSGHGPSTAACGLDREADSQAPSYFALKKSARGGPGDWSG
jgi:F5/8 type C domain-containing protein